MQYIAQNFLQTEFQILDWIAGLRTEWLDTLMPIISAFGNDGIGWIIVAVVGLFGACILIKKNPFKKGNKKEVKTNKK